jgi:hypothetical protein
MPLMPPNVVTQGKVLRERRLFMLSIVRCLSVEDIDAAVSNTIRIRLRVLSLIISSCDTRVPP